MKRIQYKTRKHDCGLSSTTFIGSPSQQWKNKKKFLLLIKYVQSLMKSVAQTSQLTATAKINGDGFENEEPNTKPQANKATKGPSKGNVC